MSSVPRRKRSHNFVIPLVFEDPSSKRVKAAVQEFAAKKKTNPQAGSIAPLRKYAIVATESPVEEARVLDSKGTSPRSVEESIDSPTPSPGKLKVPHKEQRSSPEKPEINSPVITEYAGEEVAATAGPSQSAPVVSPSPVTAPAKHRQENAREIRMTPSHPPHLVHRLSSNQDEDAANEETTTVSTPSRKSSQGSNNSVALTTNDPRSPTTTRKTPTPTNPDSPPKDSRRTGPDLSFETAANKQNNNVHDVAKSTQQVIPSANLQENLPAIAFQSKTTTNEVLDDTPLVAAAPNVEKDLPSDEQVVKPTSPVDPVTAPVVVTDPNDENTLKTGENQSPEPEKHADGEMNNRLPVEHQERTPSTKESDPQGEKEAGVDTQLISKPTNYINDRNVSDLVQAAPVPPKNAVEQEVKHQSTGHAGHVARAPDLVENEPEPTTCLNGQQEDALLVVEIDEKTSDGTGDQNGRQNSTVDSTERPTDRPTEPLKRQDQAKVDAKDSRGDAQPNFDAVTNRATLLTHVVVPGDANTSRPKSNDIVSTATSYVVNNVVTELWTSSESVPKPDDRAPLPPIQCPQSVKMTMERTVAADQGQKTSQPSCERNHGQQTNSTDKTESVDTMEESTDEPEAASLYLTRNRVKQILQFLILPILLAAAIAWAFPRAAPLSGALLLEIENMPKLTLRDILLDDEQGFHLAMAPAFFGFYGYFGALAAWYEMLGSNTPPIRSVTGASAGAMAAVLLAAGIEPKTAADFCATVTLDQFADFPGYGALFKGEKFEEMMHKFLVEQGKTLPLMEEAVIPVTVSAYDLRTFRGTILRKGPMAKAARSSATFPLLFQPVGWKNSTHEFTFIDGGIADMYGLLGLKETMDHKAANRVVNLSVGAFLGSNPPGPATFDEGKFDKVEVISVSLEGLPQPGPLALENGPLAYASARDAMKRALDTPLEPVVEAGGRRVRRNHYKLAIHAQ